MNPRLPIFFSIFLVVITGLAFGRTLTTQAANMMTCHATADDGANIFSGNNMSVVHQAITAAPVDGTVKIAGQCVGVTRFPFIVDKNVTLAGGYTNGSWATPSPETKETILSGNQEGRVLNIDGATVKLKNLTITGGQAAFGGGILANNATLLIETSTIQNNQATTGNGGGILARDSEVTVYSYSTIANNTANAGNGGGVYAETTAARGGTGVSLWISFGTVQNNSAQNGGGIAVADGVATRFTSSEITGNQAQQAGGALYFAGDSASEAERGAGGGGVSLWISFGSVWQGNSAENGGAVYLDSAEGITVTNSTFLNNTATVDGGALALLDIMRATVETSSFENNGAMGDGGATWMKYRNFRPTRALNDANVVLSDLVFTNNRAHNGGALVTANSTANLTITIAGLTMTQNTATQHGGGIYAITDGTATRQWLHSTAGQRQPVYNFEEFYFQGNRANGRGGAIYSAVADDATSDWLMTSAGNRRAGLPRDTAVSVLGAFVGNRATAGAALYLEESGNARQTTQLDTVRVLGNSADYGAAIFNNGSDLSLHFSIVATNTMTQSGVIVNAGGVMSVTQSVIKENMSSGDAGAFLNVAGSLNVTQSLIRANGAATNGGALANRSSDTLNGMSFDGTAIANIFGSTFFQNTAQDGAAFHNHRPLPIRRHAAGDATIIAVNSTLAENVAMGAGGAVWNNSGDGTARVELVQSTIALNEADAGGGVFNDQSGAGSAEIYLANTINDNTAGDDCTNRAGSFTSNDHNADSDNSCNAAINGNFSIDRNIESLPKFTLPENHSLSVLPPQRESIVTGVGEVATCRSALVGGVDQLGNFRSSATCDLGAVETNTTSVPTSVTLRTKTSQTDQNFHALFACVILTIGTLWIWRRSSPSHP